MPHFTCEIVKPDGTVKESITTGKDAAAAKAQALKDHPGCEIRKLKPKAVSVKPQAATAPVKKVVNPPVASPTMAPPPEAKPPAPATPVAAPVVAKLKVTARPTTTIVDRLYYLQHGQCFYCGDYITRADASLDHLLPVSKGGPNTDDNLIVCCKKLNQVFGDMGLKEKLRFLTSDSGNVICPRKVIQTLKGGETSGGATS